MSEMRHRTKTHCLLIWHRACFLLADSHIRIIKQAEHNELINSAEHCKTLELSYKVCSAVADNEIVTCESGKSSFQF